MRTGLIGMAGLCLAVGVVALAHAGGDWDAVESKEYGIRFAVPDEDKCGATERDGVGSLYCEGDGFQVAMIAYKGAVSMKDLRAVAHQYTEVDEKHWKLIDETSGENGYEKAEAWGAAGDGHAAAVVIGNSGKRSVSHVVFIMGKVSSWKQHAKDITRFIENIHAI
jgi:hypothetical protein